MNNESPVQNLMKSTMESLRDMIDVNTVIGDPVETRDGTYIIPISRLGFGFASGGTEFTTLNTPIDDSKDYPFGGGAGAGASVKPVAFLVVRENSIRLLPVEQDNTYDRIVDTIPQVFDMIKEMISNISNKTTNESDNINPFNE